MACNGTGWVGALTVDGATLPFLNANLVREKIVFQPTLIGWGLDSKYRSPYNHVISNTFVRGSFTTEVFSTGSFASAFTSLITAAIEGTEVDIAFSPAGGGDISVPNEGNISVPNEGKCFIESMSISCNSEGIMTAQFSIFATDSGSTGATGDSQFESVGTTEDNNPMPWYNVNITMSASGDDSDINNSAVALTLSLTNPVDAIYALNGDTAPVDIRLGTMQVSGSISYFSRSGTFKSLTDGASLSVDVGAKTINFPYLIFNSSGCNNSGQNNPVFREINFISFGHDSQKAIYLG